MTGHLGSFGRWILGGCLRGLRKKRAGIVVEALLERGECGIVLILNKIRVGLSLIAWGDLTELIWFG